jgi:hypothetical protein
MQIPEMSLKRKLLSSFGGVFITYKWKEFKVKLKFANQLVDLFLSRQAWLISTWKFIFLRSRMRLIKVGIFLLILQFRVTMSTNTIESLSTCRSATPCLRAKSIPMYIPHISAWSASQNSILREKLLRQISLGVHHTQKD